MEEGYNIKFTAKREAEIKKIIRDLIENNNNTKFTVLKKIKMLFFGITKTLNKLFYYLNGGNHVREDTNIH